MEFYFRYTVLAALYNSQARRHLSVIPALGDLGSDIVSSSPVLAEYSVSKTTAKPPDINRVFNMFMYET